MPSPPRESAPTSACKRTDCLHWWTLTHFLFESPRYREKALTLLDEGGGLEAFEKLIGPVEQVQEEWHAYVRGMKSCIARSDRDFLQTGRIPQADHTPSPP